MNHKPKMPFKAPFAILDANLLAVWPFLPDHHRRLLPILLSYMPKAFPGQKTLGKRIGRGRQAVHRALQQMENIGLLRSIVQRNSSGGNTTKLYSLADLSDTATRDAVIARLKGSQIEDAIDSPEALPPPQPMSPGPFDWASHILDSTGGVDSWDTQGTVSPEGRPALYPLGHDINRQGLPQQGEKTQAASSRAAGAAPDAAAALCSDSTGPLGSDTYSDFDNMEQSDHTPAAGLDDRVDAELTDFDGSTDPSLNEPEDISAQDPEQVDVEPHEVRYRLEHFGIGKQWLHAAEANVLRHRYSYDDIERLGGEARRKATSNPAALLCRMLENGDSAKDLLAPIIHQTLDEMGILGSLAQKVINAVGRQLTIASERCTPEEIRRGMLFAGYTEHEDFPTTNRPPDRSPQWVAGNLMQKCQHADRVWGIQAYQGYQGP